MTKTTSTDMTNITQSHVPGGMPVPAAIAVLVAAPLAEAVASALHPTMPNDLGELLAVVAQTSSWYTMSLIGLLASGLLVGLSIALGGLVRGGSPILGTIGLLVTFAGGILMASMQGFKLFLPTLARLAPGDGAAAVDVFTGGGSFTPMIGRLRPSSSGARPPRDRSDSIGSRPLAGELPRGRRRDRGIPATRRARCARLDAGCGGDRVHRPFGMASDQPERPPLRLLIRMATWRLSAP